MSFIPQGESVCLCGLGDSLGADGEGCQLVGGGVQLAAEGEECAEGEEGDVQGLAGRGEGYWCFLGGEILVNEILGAG